MRVATIALFSSLVAKTEAIGFRDLVETATHRELKSNAAAVDGADDQHRRAQNNCFTDQPPSAAWHPQYSSGWTNGFCRFTVDCNSPAYTSELLCCRGAYAGQTSGTCLSSLPSPPTMSPTESGGLDVYYPDYATSWAAAGCINTRPLPSGRPSYSSQILCCKGAYGGQVSGTCLSQLPSAPTMSPTETGGLDVYYADYATSWAVAGCINTRPFPGGRPTYSSQILCCKGAYGGQVSGTCLSQLPSAPTMSPTETGGLDVYYPDYGTAWAEAGCINTRPMPSGRPTYNTRIACCKGAYGGQTSGMCLSQLPSPPTMSPTESGGLSIYYPDYGTSWPLAGCINTRPLPSGRPTYSSQIACCRGAYAGQTSGTCLSQLPSPPTMSPTEAGGLDVYYPDYDTAFGEAGCINTRPLPNGRPSYSSQILCCKGAYAGQTSGTCLSQLPSPPTMSPTAAGGLDVYYPDYATTWSEAGCINDRPLPSGRPSYSTQESCCRGAYGGQSSGRCMCEAVGVCYSCTCGTESQRTTAGCTLTCS